MKKCIIITVVIIIITIIGLSYRQSHISITGFTVPKSALKDVIINTTDGRYCTGPNKPLSQPIKFYQTDKIVLSKVQ